MACHAETPAGNLFDGGIFRVAVRFENVTRRIFAAFAGVRATAYAIHRNSKSFVRFF